MPETPKTTFIQGQAFNRVDIPATGQWQIMRMKSIKSYVLVHPSGRQAWFSEDDMNTVAAKLGSSFRYTAHPMRDLNKLAKHGLRPFHVDDDFDPTGLAGASIQ